jgi:hypothetical protein
VPERSFAVDSETVKCVWRHGDHVPRFRDHLDTVE